MSLFERTVGRVVAVLAFRKMTTLPTAAGVGIEILSDAASGAASETASAALRATELLRSRSAVHLRWLTRCPRRIVVLSGMKSIAAYDARTRSVFLAHDTASRHDDAGIATLLAHEATHARLADAGVRLRVHDVRRRRRVEKRCVREQLEALERIDSTHYLIPWSRELLKATNEPELTPSLAARSQIAQRGYRRMRHQGVPRWIARVAVAIAAGRRKPSRGSLVP